MTDLRSIARALGGEVSGGRVRCPGPGHSKRDRSMWIDWQAPDRFVVGSFAGDDFRDCKDHVRATLGIDGWKPQLLVRTSGKLTIREPKSNVRTPDIELSTIALRLWREAEALLGTPGAAYLRHRVGRDLEWPSDLRFHPHCPRGRREQREHHPAVVALLRDVHTNEPKAIQRIFLKPDGSDRLRAERGEGDGKLTLGPATGCAIKLSPDEEIGRGLGISEGVEKALGLLAIGWAPVWVTAGTSGMSPFPVLAGIEALTIFADGDDAGQRAANTCAERWRTSAEVIIRTPRAGDWDEIARAAV